MTLGLKIMALLGVAITLIGLPVLLRPAATRALLGARDTPQMVYVLRITGTMLTALGVILLVFAFAFSQFAVAP